MTEEVAIRIALEFLKAKGCDTVGQRPTARLITRQSLEADRERAAKFQSAHPAAWREILARHRDHWTVALDTGLPKNAHPSKFYVDVDIENGEASIGTVL